MSYQYFDISEFDSPDEPGSGEEMMHPIFVVKLDLARRIAGVPFHINSGYRSVKHNKAVGGKRDSAHLKGVAADISTANALIRSKILTALILVGFTRIGISETFIHVDDDRSKAQEVVWLY